MKNSINISNNVNLILNTYRYIYIYIYLYIFKMLLRIFYVFDSFDHAKQDKSARQRGNGKILESATFKVCKQ